MRAPLGDILTTPHGQAWITQLFDECRAVASGAGYRLRQEYVTRTLDTLLTPGSLATASMLRDIESNHPVEADHILGDLIEMRAAGSSSGCSTSLLDIAYGHVKAYEARRARMTRMMSSSPSHNPTG
jgi:2-dehydropantoate 2-reductase